MYRKILSLFVVWAILAMSFGMVAFASEGTSKIIADTGANINTFCGFEVVLDGSGSTAGVSYFWRFVSKADGSSAILSDATSVIAKFTPDVLGEYVIGLTVNDGTNFSEEKTVVVKAKALDASDDDIDLQSFESSKTLSYSFKNAIPLSDGWIITADNSNKVLIANVLTGQVGKSFQLNATPCDMAIDFKTGLLMVTMNGSTNLAKVDVYGGTVSYIALPNGGSTVENADPGKVFVRTSSSRSYDGVTCVVDCATGAILSQMNTGGSLYAFNAKYNYLFTANSGISSATVWRYSYNPQTSTLTLLNSTSSLGSNGLDIRVSPDGERLIFCAGGGNGNGYTVFDIDPKDFTQRFGEFNTNAYPTAGWFSLDSKYFIAANGSDIKLFDVENHYVLDTIKSFSHPGNYEKVYFSRGSKLIYYFDGSIGYVFKNPCVDLENTGTVNVAPTEDFKALSLGSDIDDVVLKNIAGPKTLDYSFRNTIPLASGWIITADSTNKVIIANVVTDQIGASFQLNAAPLDMALDLEAGILLVTMNSSSRLAKIDIYEGTVTYIQLPQVGSTIEKADAGRVFVRLITGSTWRDVGICVVDYINDTIIYNPTTWAADGSLLAFNSKYNYLFVGNTGSSPSTLWKYSYNPQTGALTLLSKSAHGSLGSNGQDLRVSPDGEHVIFCNGGGNGDGYTVFDIDPHDITKRFGEFNTGAYPRSGWFSLDNKTFLGTNHNQILMFDVETHALLSTYPVNTNQGNVYFSRGSKLIYWFNGSEGYMFKTYIDDGTPVDVDSIEVEGYDIGFDKGITTYIVPLPDGTHTVPKINVETNEMFDVKITYPTSLPGRATVTVGAVGIVKKTYTISFAQSVRISVNVSDTYFMTSGNSANLNPYLYYNDGYSKSMSITNTAVYKSSNEAVATVDSAGRLQAKTRGYTKITVESNGFIKTIDVYVDVDVDSISVSGYDINFNTSKTSYTVSLPAGTEFVPTINYTANEMFDVKITYPVSLPGTATVTVGAGGAVRKTYGIYFDKQKETAAPVTVNVESGAVAEGTQIILSSDTSNAVIYYSLNGGGYRKYTAPIVINGITVINAYAARSDMNDSDVSTFAYSVNPTLTTATVVTVPNVPGEYGSEVEVAIKIENNPGIAAFVLNLNFDKGLSVVSADAGELIADVGSFFTEADDTPNPSSLDSMKVSWQNITNITEDGILFKVRFKVSNGVSVDNLPIYISYTKGNVIDQELNEIDISAISGGVQLPIKALPGDVFSNGAIDAKDGLKLTQFLAGMPIKFTEFEWAAADVNGDGAVDIKDGLRLAQYLAGWDVKLGK